LIIGRQRGPIRRRPRYRVRLTERGARCSDPAHGRHRPSDL